MLTRTPELTSTNGRWRARAEPSGGGLDVYWDVWLTEVVEGRRLRIGGIWRESGVYWVSVLRAVCRHQWQGVAGGGGTTHELWHWECLADALFATAADCTALTRSVWAAPGMGQSRRSR